MRIVFIVRVSMVIVYSLYISQYNSIQKSINSLPIPPYLFVQLKPFYRFSLFTTHAPTGDADVYARKDRVNDLNENHFGTSADKGETYHRPVREIREHGQLR